VIAFLRRLGIVAVVVGAALLVPAPATAAPRSLKTLEIATIPPTPGARFTLDGVPLVTDPRGVATTQVERSAAPHRIELLNPTTETVDATSEFVRWQGHGDSDQGYTPVLENIRIEHTLRLRVAFRESRTVRFSFVDQASRPVDPSRVTAVTLRSDTGRTQTVSPGDPLRLTAVRPTAGDGQLLARATTYSVQSVTIDGANVVNVGEQRFRPSQVGGELPIVVLLRTAHFRVQDRFLGTPIATVLQLRYPDGRVEPIPTDERGEVVVEDLARGTYTVSAQGQAYAIDQELALSRSQRVDIMVLSVTDAAIAAGVVVVMIVVLVGLGRWRSAQLRADAAGEPVAGEPPEPLEAVETVDSR
jgi:hypothetical protein